MGRESPAMASSKGQGHGGVVKDSRFAKLHFDPRFQRMSKKTTKLRIDSRFQHMFSDKTFSDPASVDKRGKPTKAKSMQTKKDTTSLHHLYRLDESDTDRESPSHGCLDEDASFDGGEKSGARFDGGKNSSRVRSDGGKKIGASSAGVEKSGASSDGKKSRVSVDGGEKSWTSSIGGKKSGISSDRGEKSGVSFDGKKSRVGFVGGEKSLVSYDRGEKNGASFDGNNSSRVSFNGGKKRGARFDGGEKSEARLDVGKTKGVKQGKKLNLSVDGNHQDTDEEEISEENEKEKEKKKKRGLLRGKKVGIRNSLQAKRALDNRDTDDGNSEEEVVEEKRERHRGKQSSIDKDIRKKLHAEQLSEGTKDSSSSSDSEDLSSSEIESPSSSSSSSSDEDSDAASDFSDEEEDEEENVPRAENATRRIAIVNMDWCHVTAVDLLVLLNSFLPKDGHILSVSVYPSEFGLQQMKDEEKQGPKYLLSDDDNDDDDDDDEDGDDQGNGVNMKKLRNYEKAKLRYFYAVVEFDSSTTSDYVYKACDGMEFERSSNMLDLRFVPDDMVFAHPARDVASEVPVDYEAPLFETRALQHSTVKLTWDDDEPVRVKALRRKFTAEQLQDMDFKDYLASEEDEDENAEVAAVSNSEGESDGEASLADTDEPGHRFKKDLREKYKSLLLAPTEESPAGRGKDRDNELEVTFHSGLDELSKRLMEKKKSHGEETVWEAYLRKKKEKKKDGKKALVPDSDGSSSDGMEASEDPFFARDNDPFDDGFFESAEDTREGSSGGVKPRVKKGEKQAAESREEERSKRRSQVEKAKKEEAKRTAELELLLADDQGLETSVKGYNLKKKRVKGKLKDVEKLEEKLPTVNYEDPRFSTVFTSHHYAIDPTDPRFKRSAAHLRVLVEKQQKRLDRNESNGEKLGSKLSDNNSNNQDVNEPVVAPNSVKRKRELSGLVRSLKQKLGGDRKI